jgi:hypothetical protein
MSPPSSSLPPAGVPDSGGNAKYAVIAVVLLLAAGGLFAWRTLGSRGGTVAPPIANTPPPLQPPVNPKIEDIPLPPPPEEKPEGGTGPRIIYVPAGGCTEKCTGTAPPELGSVLQVRAGQARRCYNQALSSDSSLKGKVTIEVRIGPTGNVCSATVASNDMGSPNVANCAANIFRSSGGYPAPHGGCVVANVPLSFVPQGGGGP